MPDFPSPQIEFADELEPVIEILEILQDLQGGNYKDAFAHGLKLAMSNKAGTWEYKFEASKEIPVLRFPVPTFLYNDPNAPLKLEAGLKIGAYFNAALKVTTDAKQLLPTAGAFVGFYGRLSVMCVSLSAATIYAIGQVNLDIAADTKSGPALQNEIRLRRADRRRPAGRRQCQRALHGRWRSTPMPRIVEVSAFLLFQGHAELLGGLVCVTITIEAKGTSPRHRLIAPTCRRKSPSASISASSWSSTSASARPGGAAADCVASTIRQPKQARGHGTEPAILHSAFPAIL